MGARWGMLAALLLLAGCGGGSLGPATAHRWPGPVLPAAVGPAATGPAATRYAAPGPYAVGTTAVTVDGDRTQLWWPADPAAATGRARYVYRYGDWLPAKDRALIPAARDRRTGVAVDGAPPSRAARFPVVLFSHGYGTVPTQSTYLTEHLASWGFVVAAPDHRARDLATLLDPAAATGGSDVDDLRRTLAWLRAQDAGSGPLAGRLDLAHVAVVGHSAGGHAGVELAGADAEISAYVTLAGVPGEVPPSRPALLIAGGGDHIVPAAAIRDFYDQLPAPKRLVVVDRAGHNAFDDFCPDGTGFDLGGLPVPAVIAAAARDGCTAQYAAARTVWPLVDHATVAELRWAFGTDPEPTGLDAGLGHAFPGLPAEVDSA